MNDLQFMPHQEEVLNMTDDKNRCAYYLDMGLGKTFVGAEKMYLLNNTVNLIVCQKSKIDDWVDHMKTYYPEYRVMDLTKKSEGVNFRTLVETKDLYDQNIQIVGVINYDLVFRRKYIAHITDFTLLLDESSLICNENAKRSKFILKLQPESVILLSGTPTAGKYERLWSQLKLLGWDINKKAFYASYVQTEWIENGDGYKKEVITGYKHVEHLKKRLTQFGAVFMKTEEVIELPEQTEQKIFLKITNEYKFFIKHNYLELDTRNLVRFKDDSDFEGEDVTPRVELIGDNSLTKTLYCRQLCGQWHKEKLEAFRDLLESTEDRLIVFYNFNEELTRLRKICESLNREVSFVNGSGRSMYAYECVDNSVTSASAYLLNDEQVMNTGEDKFSSIAGARPASGSSQNLTRPNIEAMAQNRGTNWHGDLIKQVSAEQMLMIIEMGMMNLQTAIAQGVVSLPWTTGSDTTSSYAAATGSTASLGNGTGRAEKTTTYEGGVAKEYTVDGKTSVCWRGKENFWGNIWKFVYGINIWGNGKMGGGQPYICSDFSFAESKNSGNYEPAGFTVTNANGYISAMGYSTACDWLFIASECLGNSSLPVGDYTYITVNLNGYRIAPLGGGWYSGGSAGGFGWYLYNGVGNRSRSIGGRLVYIPTRDSATYTAAIEAWKQKMAA